MSNRGRNFAGKFSAEGGRARPRGGGRGGNSSGGYSMNPPRGGHSFSSHSRFTSSHSSSQLAQGGNAGGPVAPPSAFGMSNASSRVNYASVTSTNNDGTLSTSSTLPDIASAAASNPGGLQPRTAKFHNSISQAHGRGEEKNGKSDGSDKSYYSDEKLIHAMCQLFVGQIVEVMFINKSSLTGVLKSFADDGNIGFELCVLKKNDVAKDEVCSQKYTELIGHFKEIRTITVSNIQELLPKSNEISTDAEIAKRMEAALRSGSGGIGFDDKDPHSAIAFSRDLVPYYADNELPNETDADLDCLKQCKQGDTWFPPEKMFKVNEHKFGVVSTFDEEMREYTVPLNRDDPDYQRKYHEAEVMARQIEGEKSNRRTGAGGGASEANRRKTASDDDDVSGDESALSTQRQNFPARHRGQAGVFTGRNKYTNYNDDDNDEEDEEMRYSAVHRSNTRPPQQNIRGRDLAQSMGSLSIRKPNHRRGGGVNNFAKPSGYDSQSGTGPVPLFSPMDSNRVERQNGGLVLHSTADEPWVAETDKLSDKKDPDTETDVGHAGNVLTGNTAGSNAAPVGSSSAPPQGDTDSQTKGLNPNANEFIPRWQGKPESTMPTNVNHPMNTVIGPDGMSYISMEAMMPSNMILNSAVMSGPMFPLSGPGNQPGMLFPPNANLSSQQVFVSHPGLAVMPPHKNNQLMYQPYMLMPNGPGGPMIRPMGGPQGNMVASMSFDGFSNPPGMIPISMAMTHNMGGSMPMTVVAAPMTSAGQSGGVDVSQPNALFNMAPTAYIPSTGMMHPSANNGGNMGMPSGAPQYVLQPQLQQFPSSGMTVSASGSNPASSMATSQLPKQRYLPTGQQGHHMPNPQEAASQQQQQTQMLLPHGMNVVTGGNLPNNQQQQQQPVSLMTNSMSFYVHGGGQMGPPQMLINNSGGPGPGHQLMTLQPGQQHQMNAQAISSQAQQHPLAISSHQPAPAGSIYSFSAPNAHSQMQGHHHSLSAAGPPPQMQQIMMMTPSGGHLPPGVMGATPGPMLICPPLQQFPHQAMQAATNVQIPSGPLHHPHIIMSGQTRSGPAPQTQRLQ